MTKAAEHPSALFGTVERALRVLENEGANPFAILQEIIDSPVIRRQVIELVSPPEYTLLTSAPLQIGILRLFKAVFGWDPDRTVTPSERLVFDRLCTKEGFNQLVADLNIRSRMGLMLRFGIGEDEMPAMSRASAASRAKIGVDRLQRVEEMMGTRLRRELIIADFKVRNLTAIEVLGLSTKIENILKRAGIDTVEELILQSGDRLLHLNNFYSRDLDAIESTLAARGQKLQPSLPEH